MENSAEFRTRRPTQNWRFAELELCGNKSVYSIARDYELIAITIMQSQGITH